MIQLHQVERCFQVGEETVHALHPTELQIQTGEFVAVMGPSGSGKSTLLNILGLLDRPSKGSYQFDGIDTTKLNELEQAQIRRHRIGFVFQSFHLIPRLTAAENIALPLTLAGVAPAERRERVNDALSALDITDRATHRPDQLSGGQRQRVAIARATIMQPQIILADEPTGNLDHLAGERVIQILAQLNQDGITLIIVTHDPIVGSRAHRQIQMLDGRIVTDSSAESSDASH